MPPRQRLVPRADAAAQHHVADAQLDEADRVRDDPAVVLVVGMDHDDDVGPAFQGVAVARLLIAAVAAVLRVDDDRQAHLAGHLDGAVLAAVVHEDDLIDAAGGHVGQRGGQRALGVVGRHDGDDAMRGVWAAAPASPRDAIDVEELVAQVQFRSLNRGHWRALPHMELHVGWAESCEAHHAPLGGPRRLGAPYDDSSRTPVIHHPAASAFERSDDTRSAIETFGLSPPALGAVDAAAPRSQAPAAAWDVSVRAIAAVPCRRSLPFRSAAGPPLPGRAARASDSRARPRCASSMICARLRVDLAGRLLAVARARPRRPRRRGTPGRSARGSRRGPAGSCRTP